MYARYIADTARPNLAQRPHGPAPETDDPASPSANIPGDEGRAELAAAATGATRSAATPADYPVSPEGKKSTSTAGGVIRLGGSGPFHAFNFTACLGKRKPAELMPSYHPPPSKGPW
jgi:hypothetical protein